MKILASLALLTMTFNLLAKDRVLYDPKSGHVGHKVFKVDLVGDMQISSGKLDENGDELEFNTNESYMKFDGSTNFHYGFTKNIELFSGIRGRMIISENQTNKITNTGVESVLFGGKFAFKRTRSYEMAIYGSFRKSLFTNDDYLTANNQNEIIALGDEGSEITFGGALTYFIDKKLSLHGDVAYNIAPGELSNEILFKAEIAKLWNTAAIKVGVDGVFSMGQDERTGLTKIAIGSSPSNTFNSINRERIRPYAGFNVKLGKRWRLDANGFMILSGASTDTGIGAFGALTYYSKSSRQSKFKEYEVEATLTKVSRSQRFVRIDKGATGDVEKGMKVDIYKTDYFGGNVLIASGVVYEVGSGWSIVKVLKKYRKRKLKSGLTARLY